VAITWLVAERMPLTTSGRPSGTSTPNSTPLARMPMPSAASRTAGSTPSMPTTVLARMGGMASTTRATMAGHSCTGA